MTADFHPTWYLFLTQWHAYAMAVTGLIAVFLAQNAFHAGPITASQAALVIVDPLASIAIGVGLFGDTIHTAGSRAPLEITALVGLFAGAFVLSRSPLIAHIRSEEPLVAPKAERSSDIESPGSALDQDPEPGSSESDSVPPDENRRSATPRDHQFRGPTRAASAS
jgi:hypothetical protein